MQLKLRRLITSAETRLIEAGLPDLAHDAAMSRLYGAIHYRSDCEVGLQTGAKVGQYAVQRGKTDGAGN